jgi:hypothetical protein
MVVYDGTYRLQLDADRALKPGTKWACAWRVRIINLTVGQPAVRHLKPTVVVANQTGLATSLTSCAEAVGKKISLDFKLDINKVLWIENIPSQPGQWHAAVFTPQAAFGPDKNYNIKWRPILPNETNLIKPFIPEI